MVKKTAIFFKLFLFLCLTFLSPNYSFAMSTTSIQNALNAITTINESNLNTFNNNVIKGSNVSFVLPNSTLASDIFNKTKAFYDARSDQSVSYLSSLKDMLWAAKSLSCFNVFGGSFGSTIGGWHSTVVSEIGLYSNFSNFLKNSCTTPKSFLTNVVSVDSYNKKYYQDYPSTSDSIYSRIYWYCNNIDANLESNLDFLQDLLNILNAANGKKFLIIQQQNSITSSITNVSSQKSKLDGYLLDFKTKLITYQDDPAGLNAYVILNNTFSRKYLQNYPKDGSLYIVLSNLYTNRETKFLAKTTIAESIRFLTNLQIALSYAKTKLSLTAAQQTDVGNWATIVDQEIKLINNFNSNFSNTTTVSQLTAFISMYNRSYFQNAPSTTNSIYTKIQNLFNQRPTATTQPDPTKLKTDITALQSLLVAAQNKNFLNTTQTTDINSWHTVVTSELNNIVIPIAGSGSLPVSGGAASITPSFTFDPSRYGRDAIVYNATTWVAPARSEGNFTVKFKARGQKDLYVQLSPSPSAMAGKVYNINIGGDNNTTTWVRNDTTGAGTIIGNKVTNSSALITGGLPGDGSTWDDYSIKIVNNDIISLCKGPIIGANKAVEWFIPPIILIPTLPTPKIIEVRLSQNVKYVGFGGYSSVIQFANIQIVPNDQVIAIKSSFATDLGNATTIDGLLAIINNSDYNQTYLQNYPDSVSNSIYIKLKGLVDNRIANYLGDPNTSKTLSSTLTNLQNLLDIAKTKNFLTGTSIADGQKKDIDGWSTTLASEKAFFSSFESQFTAASTMDALQVIIINPLFNVAILTDYPNSSSSIFTKIQGFVNSRTNSVNKNETYYTNLKNLLISAKDKNFVSASQNTAIIALVATVNSELNDILTQKNQPTSQTVLQPSQSMQQRSTAPQFRRRGPVERPQGFHQRDNRQSSTVKIR